MTNEELYLQYLSGDTEAFEQLYLQMQGFIASVAKDAAQSFGCTDKETLDELCAEGALELCECLSTGAYDEDRGKLTTYLHPFLRGKMYRYLEANVGVIALPKDEMQRVKQAQRLHKEEKFSPDEVAQTLGVSAEKAAQLIGCKTKSLSVSALSGTIRTMIRLRGCCSTSTPSRQSRLFTGRSARRNWSSFSVRSARKTAQFSVIPTACSATRSCLRTSWACAKCSRRTA